jgi:hypothetical protein
VVLIAGIIYYLVAQRRRQEVVEADVATGEAVIG